MPRYVPPPLTDVELFAYATNSVDTQHIPSGSGFWYFMALGYKHAADDLVDTISSAHRGQEWRAAPVLFLYRHYVELHLKSLLLDAGELLDDQQQVPPQHYLLVLWKRVRALLLKVESDESDRLSAAAGPAAPWLLRVDAIVAQLDAVDPSSFAFRYPVDNKGQPSLPPSFRFEAVNVRSVIGELHSVLTSATNGVDYLRDVKRDAGASAI